MAETRELQVLRCPACNAKFTNFSVYKKTVTCPACHNVITQSSSRDSQGRYARAYDSFLYPESDFESALTNTLINQDYVPRDIFQAINAGNVFRAYLPMYLYEGSYQASWSCESSYRDRK